MGEGEGAHAPVVDATYTDHRVSDSLTVTHTGSRLPKSPPYADGTSMRRNGFSAPELGRRRIGAVGGAGRVRAAEWLGGRRPMCGTMRSARAERGVGLLH